MKSRANFPCVKKNPQQLCSDIFEFHGFTAENMIKLIAKNVKAESLRKLTECAGNKPNMSQIWLCGFELTTHHHCNHTNYFLKIVQKLCALQNCDQKPFWRLISPQITSLSDTKYREKNLIILYLLRNDRSILPIYAFLLCLPTFYWHGLICLVLTWISWNKV